MSPCKTGKIQFQCWTDAQRSASHARRNEEGRCQVYRCEFCGKWHLGRKFGKVTGKRPHVEERENGRAYDR